MEKFIKTTGDWHPNYPGDTVKVEFKGNIAHPSMKPVYSIFVSGKDDTAMYLDHEDRDKLLSVYTYICNLPVITEEYLESVGFQFH